jgi:tetratricopeptide (TPR) repeat protein
MLYTNLSAGLAVDGRALFLVGAFLLSLSGCGKRDSTQELFDRGYAAFQRGDNVSLHQCITRLDAIAPESDQVLLLGALVCERSQDYATALKLMSQMNPEGSLRQPLLLHGAICYHQAGLLTQAARMTRLLTSEFPEDADGHRWAGVVHYDLGAYDFAVTHLKRVGELEPSDYRPLRLLGIMYCDFARNTEAIDVLSKALTLNPPEHVRPEMIEQLARAQIAERRYGDALNVLRSEHVSATATALTAECLFNLGDPSAASDAIEAALKQEPENRDALLQKAIMHSTSGDQQQALPILARLVETDPFDTESRYQYSLALRALGETQAAEEQMLTWQEQKELADQLTKKNVEALSRPFDTALRLEIAELCEQLGKDDLAIMWRRAADAEPGTGTSPQPFLEAQPVQPGMPEGKAARSPAR